MKTLTNLLLSGAILGLIWYIWGDQVSDMARSKKSVDSAQVSQNSLDWAGVYRGLMPCVDCDELNVSVTLTKDGTFEIIESSASRNEDAEYYSGEMIWDDTGPIVTLAHYRFVVAEGALELLDINGSAPDHKKTYLLLLTK